MASSVARMLSDDWRDPNRITAGVFGAHVHASTFGKNLKKVLVRERHQPTSFPSLSPSSSFSSSSSSVNQECIPSKTESSSVDEVETPASAARRRQSQILDRWAARQAREMITTIERQAHEAELSALSTTTQPVSARAATFLRDTSPTFSDSSAGSNSTATATASSGGSAGASAGGNGGIDLPPNVRASSLIQMWRELEAEARFTPTHRMVSGGSGGSGGTGIATAASSSEPSDDSEASGDWESEVMAPSEPASSSLTEREKGRVGNIVKMLSLGNRTQSSETSWRDEINESTLVREQSVVSSDQRDGFGLLVGSLVQPRSRREMEDIVEKMEKERRREVAKLAEHQAVSRFSHRGRIQSVLRLSFLRRELVVQDQLRHASRTLESERSQSGATILFLRERFDHRSRHGGSGDPIMESSSTVDVQFPIDSQDSGSTHSADQFNIDNNQFQEVVSTGDPENSPPELNSPHSRSEGLQEGSQSLDTSWDDRSLWVSNLDWQRPMDSSTLHGWQGEAVTEELEPFTKQPVVNTGHTWIGDSSNSWRGWGVSRQAYHDLLENFSDNVEIRELLERRRVSTSLASDFCDKMNRLIKTILHRQEQQCVDENFSEEFVEQPIWRQNYEFNNADQVASGSSLVPLSYPTVHYPDRWQHTSFTHHSSQNLRELESMHDLRTDMAQIHQEISELRKLVESCREWQTKLQDSIKEEVSSAVHQSVIVGNTSQCSKWTPSRKDSCCICYEMQVDSLLYRCGHMCTCFKCAHELQWSSGRCPICRAPIVDVVRAYPNS